MARILMIITLSLSLLGAAGAAAEELTLDRAVELALANNQTLRAAQYDASAAAWGFGKSISAWLPKVFLDSSWTRPDPETVRDAEQSYESLKRFSPDAQPSIFENNYSTSISLVQPIFNGGAELAAIEAGNINRRGADLTAADTRLQTVLDVKKSYYTVQKTKALLRVARESLTLAQESLKFAKARLEIGAGTDSDVLRWEAEVAGAQGNLAAADNAYAQALMNLARVIGRPIDEKFQLPEMGEDLEPQVLADAEKADLAGAKSTLPLVNHPALGAADASVDLAQVNTWAAAGKFLPNINFTYTYQWPTDDTIWLEGERNWTMGVTVEIPLFQGLGAIMGTGQSYRQEQSAKMKAEAFDQTFFQRAYAALLTLRSARLRVVSARQAVKYAQANLAIVEKRGELGLSSNLEVLDTQILYKRAQSDLIGSISDFFLALAEWEYVTSGNDQAKH